MASAETCPSLVVGKPTDTPRAVCKSYGFSVEFSSDKVFTPLRCPLLGEGIRNGNCEVIHKVVSEQTDLIESTITKNNIGKLENVPNIKGLNQELRKIREGSREDREAYINKNRTEIGQLYATLTVLVQDPEVRERSISLKQQVSHLD